MNSRLPPLIAVIGSDGSGKSTVCEQLITDMNNYGPAIRVHLGKQAGNVGRAVAQWPVIGRFLDKAITRNTKKVKTGKSKVKFLPSLVIMAFVLRRVLRFRRMMQYRREGLIVLTDRFPQAQIPGAYDGPVFPVNIKGNPFIRWMAGRERKAFKWMAAQKPDLVIKLNVDLDVACQRKPDHPKEQLEKKIATTPLLTFEGARIINIDANQPIADVISHAESAIRQFMDTHGYQIQATRNMAQNT